MDLQSNLLEYQVQLEQVGFKDDKIIRFEVTGLKCSQVEIALKNDPDNEDILKLKNDLVVRSF